MKRAFDFIMAAGALIVFALPMLVVAVAVRTTSKGPAIYWSDRVGRDNKLFRMPKFRARQLRSDPWTGPI